MCRNPNGEKTIWCYTTDSTTRWEYCDPVIEGAIKKVPVKAKSSEPEPSQEDLTGKDKESAYRGSQIKTIDGELCMEWADNEPHQHMFHAEQYPEDDLRKNFCRNPGKAQSGTWCFT